MLKLNIFTICMHCIYLFIVYFLFILFNLCQCIQMFDISIIKWADIRQTFSLVAQYDEGRRCEVFTTFPCWHEILAWKSISLSGLRRKVNS